MKAYAPKILDTLADTDCVKYFRTTFDMSCVLLVVVALKFEDSFRSTKSVKSISLI